MIRKLALPAALAAGLLLAGSGAEARDGCGPGFHRGYYGFCRPNWRPYAYAPVYRWGGPRWHYGYRYRWHRHFAWHRWGGYHRAGWGGRGWGWHHRRW